MKQQLAELVHTALSAWADALPTELGLVELPPVQIEDVRRADHGDFASNIALMVASRVGHAPRAVAESLVALLPDSPAVSRIEIAGPGFINFFMKASVFQKVVAEVLDQGQAYGCSTMQQGQRVHLEFVSANPTGPLHVGHGRAAAYGATVANLLRAVGATVHSEYYVNDAGRQMHILALSVWLRYLALCGAVLRFPEQAYQGDYVIAIAQDLKNRVDHEYWQDPEAVFADLTKEDADAYIDALMQRMQMLLPVSHYNQIFQWGLSSIQAGIERDLSDFGVTYTRWFRESSLLESGHIEDGLEELRRRGAVYKQDGATWFRATDFGDDKDRVLIRENGQHTYFAADVAYHSNTYAQGYHRIVDIFGSDHHGYVSRIRGFLKALDCDSECLDILLVQFVVLYRGKAKVSMSTRSGTFVTLRALYEEVGCDAARFFYVMRKRDQHLDFDLELAKSQSQENPVYYIQYAHARICRVFQQWAERDGHWDAVSALSCVHHLESSYEQALLRHVARYPEVVEKAACAYEPHMLAYYLQELANMFHSYYNAEQFLVAEEAVRNARLCLIAAVRQVIANGLTLLGVSAPEVM